MPRYRKNWGHKKKIPKSLISLLILIMCVYIFSIVEKNLKPTIVQIAETRAHVIATEAINTVLYEKVLADVNYNDLILVHKDSQQRITMMQANTIRISRIISQANLEIKECLKQLDDERFQIPLGQTLGSQLLANYGPRINVNIVPIGTVDIKCLDEFQQAGINQVRHILYLDIEATVKIVVPLVTESVVVANKIPIAETVIVGEVPDTYLGIQTPLAKGLLYGNDSMKEKN